MLLGAGLRQANPANQLNWDVGHVELEDRVGGQVAEGAVLALSQGAKVIEAVHRGLCHDFLGDFGSHIDEYLVDAANARVCVLRDQLWVLIVQGGLILDITLHGAGLHE